mmetsp:Transcript_28293/g.52616  ORF Transcript_28293/g.52616 Transcript_28293/m.52616 type:complete len:200 (-) Transcript_28293:4804-5403(-)
MQGWIKKSNAQRPPIHQLKELNKHLALHRQKRLQSHAAIFRTVGKDYLTHSDQLVCFKKHVFRSTKPNAFRLESQCRLGIRRRICVGAHTNVAAFICPVHQGLKGVIQRRFEHSRFTRQNLSICAIHSDHITFCEDPAIRRHDPFFTNLKPHRRCADNTGQTKATPNHRRMASHPTAFCQGRTGGMHSSNILWIGFPSN